MNDQYKAGWNQLITDPNAKRPRYYKKNEQFLVGWYDSNGIIETEIHVAISECRNPIRPVLL